MTFLPLAVLGAVVFAIAWLIKKARVTAADVIDEAKGLHAGAHLPSMNPEVRDVLIPRSAAVDAEIDRYRSSGPNAAGG